MPPVSQVEVSTLSTEGGEGGGGGLSREDCLCPICLDILLEPVTLPCEHTFCKECFLESADKASMCCPLCRKRVATWSRLHSRKNTMVNQMLWTRIQAAFPLQCQRRIRGQEDGGDDNQVCLSRPRVSEPGEVRREYEDQISKLAEEKRTVEEAERSASEQYIKALLAEEEQRLAEERRRQEETQERQLEDDERLAKLLNLELNTSPISASQTNVRTNIGSAAKKKHNTSGDIQKFFSPVPLRVSSSSDSSPTSSWMANKENIIHSQGSTSLTRDPSECSMPRLDYYGQETNHSSLPSGPTALLGTLEPVLPDKHQSGDVGFVQSHSDRDGGMTSSGKRKSSEMDLERCTKRPCPSPPSSSSSSLSSSLLLHELIQQQHEEELAKRRHQEEEDMRMAVLLQKTLDTEEKRRATDRSKGSNNAYHLRESPIEDSPKCPIEISPNASMTTGSSGTVKTNISRTKTGVSTGTNRSTRKSEKPKKQTTLKEMFDRLGKH